MGIEIRATFLNVGLAREARRRLIAEGVPAAAMALDVAAPRPVQETAREGRAMWRIVVIVALASVAGTGLGAALGVALHLIVGPEGTSGLVIEVVSWAIFAHLLIGMWAGYLLLADRSEREIGRARPVTLTLRCANIDGNTMNARLQGLGAIEVEESNVSGSANPSIRRGGSG